MSWTLCTSGSAIVKAGAYANSSIIASGSVLAEWSDEVEAAINVRSRYDWVANYDSLKTNFKKILADIASDMIATKIIAYDTSGYEGSDVSLILNVLDRNIQRNFELLEKAEYREKVQ